MTLIFLLVKGIKVLRGRHILTNKVIEGGIFGVRRHRLVHLGFPDIRIRSPWKPQ